ncbi:PREDICTED: uncharacterized protein LOC108551599 [Eufriesea mexicana]|uniref:uncharacterized protein LOC108551599 n=1 Tax=Eufriesea mexicana TaxID=516756 RepID=UPI00083C0A82|nr:PREDICTED: uncharacterized protein LOC108551599 [Eufriesea mexicana]
MNTDSFYFSVNNARAELYYATRENTQLPPSLYQTSLSPSSIHAIFSSFTEIPSTRNSFWFHGDCASSKSVTIYGGKRKRIACNETSCHERCSICKLSVEEIVGKSVCPVIVCLVVHVKPKLYRTNKRDNIIHMLQKFHVGLNNSFVKYQTVNYDSLKLT